MMKVHIQNKIQKNWKPTAETKCINSLVGFVTAVEHHKYHRRRQIYADVGLINNL